MPVGEELWLVPADGFQPGPGSQGPTTQSFVFLHCPSDQVLVDTPCDGVKLGAVERPVVADPAPHMRVDVRRMPDSDRALRRLRCHALILAVTVLVALSLMAGLKPMNRPYLPRMVQPRKV